MAFFIRRVKYGSLFESEKWSFISQVKNGVAFNGQMKKLIFFFSRRMVIFSLYTEKLHRWSPQSGGVLTGSLQSP